MECKNASTKEREALWGYGHRKDSAILQNILAKYCKTKAKLIAKWRRKYPQSRRL